ncbi:MAG: hypothetical protein ACOCQQ_02890 [Candidatus Nanoarchaeia archaeon]
MVKFSSMQLTIPEQQQLITQLLDRTSGLEAMHKSLFDSHFLVEKSQERIVKEFTFEKNNLTTDFDIVIKNAHEAREYIFSLGAHLRTCVTRQEFDLFSKRVDDLRFEELITKKELGEAFDNFEMDFLK